MKTWIYILFFILVYGCAQANTTVNTLNNSYCKIVEKTINLPILQQYYHINTYPERVPLIVVVDRFVSNCAELKKFDKSIKVMDSIHSKELQNETYIKITIENIDPATIKVTFAYKLEGIKGRIKLIRDNSKWVVSESKIVEI